MGNKFRILLHLFITVGFIFGLIAADSINVNAQTICTWYGDVNTDWYEAGNWDCPGGPPVSTDYDVVIPSDGPTRYPILDSNGVHVNSLLIETDGVLSIDAGFQIGINSNSFINNGTINIVERSSNSLKIYGGTFNNNGTVNIGSYQSWLILLGAGTHSGNFIGNRFNFNQVATRQLNTFLSTSNIDVRQIYVLGNHDIDIDGPFDCSNDFIIRNDSQVTISTSGIVDLGDVTVEDTSELILRLTDGSYDPGTDLVISAGEVFSGSGTVLANLTNAGTVSPGSSPGTITIDGDYTQESSGTLSIELGGTTPDIEHDQLIVTGNAILDGTLQVNLIEPYTPVLGDTFTILTYGSYTGSFNSLELAELTTGLGWEFEYGSDDFVLTVVDASASISGNVIYIGEKGLNPITVGLFENPDDQPVKTLEVNSTTGTYPYTFDNLISGTYFIGALMDLNDNHQPDTDEPYAVYSLDGEPFAFELDPGETIGGIDFTLDDPNFIYLPLILR